MQWDDNKRKVLRRVLYVAGILLLLFLAFAIYAMQWPGKSVETKVIAILSMACVIAADQMKEKLRLDAETIIRYIFILALYALVIWL